MNGKLYKPRPPKECFGHSPLKSTVWKSHLKLEKLEVQIFHNWVRGFISDIYEVSTDSQRAGTH